MIHTITVHLPKGRESLKDYEDPTVLNLVDSVTAESHPHKDGSCVVVFNTLDPNLRFRLEEEIPGATVFPHHFSNKPLSKKHVDILAHHKVKVGDTMEDALLKMTDSHQHYRFHPHTFG